MSKSASAPAAVMRSPLHGFDLPARATPINASRGVWANEIPLLGYISLRGPGRDAPFTAAAGAALGVALPVKPCSLTQAGGLNVLWLSPDEWMIVTPREDHAQLMLALNEELRTFAHQVADNSGGYCQVLVQGGNARDVLSHCTVYDLSELSKGRVVGTTFGKSSVYLRRSGGGYCLLLRRSFADYIWRFLERAAQPYGLGIAKLERGSGDAS